MSWVERIIPAGVLPRRSRKLRPRRGELLDLDRDDGVSTRICDHAADAGKTHEAGLVPSRVQLVQAKDADARVDLTEGISSFEIAKQNRVVAGCDAGKLCDEFYGIADDGSYEPTCGVAVV